MPVLLNFTKTSLSELPIPSKRVYYGDINKKAPRGFGLYMTPPGTKCFFLSQTIEGTTKRIPIGHSPDLPLEEARKKAEKLSGQVASGENLTGRKASGDRKRPTLQKAFEDYLEIRGELLVRNAAPERHARDRC